jgi:hypothetical protein
MQHVLDDLLAGTFLRFFVRLSSQESVDKDTLTQ